MQNDTLHELSDKASCLIDAGNLKDAAALYRQVLAIDPNNFDAHLMIGSIYGELGQLVDSAKHLGLAHDLKPSDPAGGLTLARVLQAQNSVPLAIACLQRSIRAGAKDAEIYGLLASLQMECGHNGEAIDSAERAIELDDGDQQAWRLLVTLSQKAGNHEKAVVAANKVLALEPDDQGIILGLADSLIALGRLQEAERVALSASEKFPDEALILVKVAATLSKQGRYGEALSYSQRALSLQPDATATQVQHFDILEKHGDHEPAFELIKPMLESADPPLWAALGFAKLSPVFDTRDDARYLLGKFRQRTDLRAVERDAIEAALAFLDQKGYSDIYGAPMPPR